MAAGTKNRQTRSRSMDWVFRICQTLHEQRHAMTVRELVQATGAPRSTVYQLVTVLARENWLEADGSGQYFFGRTMHYYGEDYAEHDQLIQRARPLLRELSADFDETCQLCALDGNKYTVLLNEHGSRLFVISSEVGIKVPIPWTASGRILLRDWTREELLARVPAEDFTLPDGARIEPDAFMQSMQQARQDGYALTEGLVDSFACCIAVPVLDSKGHPYATICFTVNRDRPPERRAQLIRALIDAGKSLSY